MNQLSPEAARMTLAQASHPQNSAFVSAHAGAGKTRLLIDRLLRLMLDGADPARILCLTYTKAAAAEMAVRLQSRLGELVALPDPELDAQLKALHLTPSPDRRERARALFADVLDLPGGMRIDTIHAFCQGLLRRFPLEAQVSPHFSVLQDAESVAALAEAREASLPAADPACMAQLAGWVTAHAFAKLFGELTGKRDRFAAALDLPETARAAALRRVAGCKHPDLENAWSEALAFPDELRLRDGLRRIAAHGAAKVSARAQRLLAWLGAPAGERRAAWTAWESEWFTKEGKACAAGTLCNAELSKKAPELTAICLDEQKRVSTLRDEFRAHRAAAATEALLAITLPMLRAYEAAKGVQRLDYDDLIARSARLLVDPGAAWVLFKLDGGLDHLLLDEVQDTAPAQWRIAQSLTGEFFAGAGARETPRTIFAVGDRKQSIFSFQGAEPAGFAAWRGWFGSQARQAGLGWQEPVLDESFRSTAAVLRVVDAVFAGPQAARGVCEDETLQHRCRRSGHAGSVELWPLAPRPEPEPPQPWSPPERNARQETAQARLVTRIADWIQETLAAGTPLESAGRILQPGDFLVLVRSRTHIPTALVGALKVRRIPVAGLDRMRLADQPAVQDLQALCRALLLPQDELSLAEYLTSPLGGLSDASLMHLAMARTDGLWPTLQARAAERPNWQAAADDFSRLLGRVDYASPYALLTETLGAMGGRARLLARLGPEAAEPVDELLQTALEYEAAHPASLQGFLHWLERAGTEVKREPEAAGGAVRVMTVHGAKGLEAPVVILADTVGAEPDRTCLHAVDDAVTGTTLPLWAPKGEHQGPGVARARQAARASCEAEYNRLLYVALTRARDRLVVCGWQPGRSLPPGSWYTLVREGMVRAGAEAMAHPWGEGGLRLSCAQTAPAENRPTQIGAASEASPRWMGAAPLWQAAPPPPEPVRRQPLAPSRPEGAERGPAPPVRSPLARGAPAERLGRGRTLHALLQHLPELSPSKREAAAIQFAGGELAREALAVLALPALAPLFGPGSRAEQPLCGALGPHAVTGRVDRLAILPDRVLVADYKTGVTPPASAAAAPIAYLRQMAAYRALLAAIYPDRSVQAFLVFTEGPAVLELPGTLLDGYAPGAEA